MRGLYISKWLHSQALEYPSVSQYILSVWCRWRSCIGVLECAFLLALYFPFYIPFNPSLTFPIHPFVLAGDITAWAALPQWALVIHNSLFFQSPFHHPS